MAVKHTIKHKNLCISSLEQIVLICNEELKWKIVPKMQCSIRIAYSLTVLSIVKNVTSMYLSFGGLTYDFSFVWRKNVFFFKWNCNVNKLHLKLNP